MYCGRSLNSKRINIPLFITTRNRIWAFHYKRIKNYLSKTLNLYHVPCVEGLEDEVKEGCEICKDEKEKSELIYVKKKRKRDSEPTWWLAPNRYDNPVDKYHVRSVLTWYEAKSKSILKKDGRRPTAFYEVSPNYAAKANTFCNRHKGKFLSNPRGKKPTTRFMIMDPVLCWRNPKYPGPATYFVEQTQSRWAKKCFNKPILRYKFLRYSSVPENVRSRSRQSLFAPGPGRYELIDEEAAIRLKTEMQLQKRLKFRRLPYKKVNPSKYVFSHTKHNIYGYGFTRLFKGQQLIKSSKKSASKKKSQRTEKAEVRMFSSFEYIKMINNPVRSTLGVRRGSDELPVPAFQVRFNCLTKVRKRRQARENRKVVFGSGEPRFKDQDQPTVLKQEKAAPLPSYPTMRIDPSEIKSKLTQLPERLRSVQTNYRIRPFKFQPTPPVKMLLDEKLLQADANREYEFYPNNVNPKDFFKY